jgi:dienelactone hydrolase
MILKFGILALASASLGIVACTFSGETKTPTASKAHPGVDVDYTCDGKPMQGYLATPADSDAKRPGVLIIHDWNGLDDYEKGRADQLAELGYVAFCADIYGKGIRPKNAQESSAESGKYYADQALLNRRSKAALDYLAGNSNVNGSVAAIGYCFGGKTVLDMVRAGMNLKGVVSFHGSLATNSPLKAGVFKGSILVLHGADDPYVPPKDVEALKSEMTAAKANFEFVAYPGAVHAFTVPSPDGGSEGAKYNKEADLKSWDAMKAFFAKILK